MLAERPIIASRAGGIPELISDGAEGVLTDPRDGDLPTIIERVIEAPEAHQAMASRARARALSEFTYEKGRQSWLAAYREVGICR
jgi:glycosyltransferase involved in cell wall biosynthesis